MMDIQHEFIMKHEFPHQNNNHELTFIWGIYFTLLHRHFFPSQTFNNCHLNAHDVAPRFALLSAFPNPFFSFLNFLIAFNMSKYRKYPTSRENMDALGGLGKVTDVQH